MAKQLHRNGFTLIEMLLVLTIVSLVIFITIAHPQLNLLQNPTEYEIKKLTSQIEYYQAFAIKSQNPVLLVFRPYRNDIKVETVSPHRVLTIPLQPLQLKDTSNIDAIQFDKEGKANKFGTLRFEHHHHQISLIFHIEQGRYRISYQK